MAERRQLPADPGPDRRGPFERERPAFWPPFPFRHFSGYQMPVSTMSSSVNPASVFTKYPTYHAKKSRWFYPVYDATWLAFLLLVVGVIAATGYQGLVPSFAEFRWEYLLAFPLLTYVLILGNVFAHNVAHRNLPKPINRLVGEVAGALVLTRYASWEIIHLRHHRYSDQPGKDPHDCRPGYWNFLWHFLLNVEHQLKQNFYDYHGGPTDRNRRFEKWRALLSFSTGMMLIATYYLVLGPPLFLLMFVPAQILTILHLAHFNWATHNGMSEDRDYRPINIDRGLYWLGNRIFFGIYYHDNHHRVVKVFNPMRLDRWLEANRRRRTREPEALPSQT